MGYPSVSDIIKLIKTGATIEAQERIMELRQGLMDLQAENLGLRARVQELETRMQELAATSLPRCPRCGKAAFALERSEKDPVMGAVGLFRRLYQCRECGFSEDRQEPGTPDETSGTLARLPYRRGSR